MTVTLQGKKADFVSFVKLLVENVYATAASFHLVLDNLNTHFRQSFVDVWTWSRRRRDCGESNSTTRPNTRVG